MKEQDLASKADAKREREINDILLLRIQRLQEGLSEVPQTPPRQVAHDQEEEEEEEEEEIIYSLVKNYNLQEGCWHEGPVPASWHLALLIYMITHSTPA